MTVYWGLLYVQDRPQILFSWQNAFTPPALFDQNVSPAYRDVTSRPEVNAPGQAHGWVIGHWEIIVVERTDVRGSDASSHLLNKFRGLMAVLGVQAVSSKANEDLQISFRHSSQHALLTAPP